MFDWLRFHACRAWSSVEMVTLVTDCAGIINSKTDKSDWLNNANLNDWLCKI